MSFNYYVPTRILYGEGALNQLGEQSHPGKKAVIVISNGKSTRSNGYLARCEEQLKKANVQYVVFDQVEANPLKKTVMAGALFAKENSCDFLVALGGGSVMDASKAISLMATNDGDYWDYVNAGSGKAKPIKNKPLPVVAITTTSGTGSEADPWSVITNEQENEKIGFGSEAMFPVLSIVDPELMMTIPAKYTAYQGFDALFHSTEGYISKFANEMSDLYALKAIEYVSHNLEKAVLEGTDKEARAKVALGSTFSGIVMSVGAITSEHSLEHAMSAYHQQLPHGAGLLMISKAYYTHFVENAPELRERFIAMAKAMGNENATDPLDFVKELVRLQAACGVDELKMSDYGIERNEFETLTTNAKQTMGGLFVSDRIELSDQDCIKIYEQSYR